MSADCCRKPGPSASASGPRAASHFAFHAETRAHVGSGLGLVSGLAAVLAPKCPMCLAAYLSMFGIGIGFAKIAPLLFPLGIVVASIAFVSLLMPRRRPRLRNKSQTTQSPNDT